YTPAWLRAFLWGAAGIFAIAATLLIFLSTSAATVMGQTPFASISLVEGINTGVLGPGEQRWFRFRPDEQGAPVQAEQSLTFIFTPGDGNHIGSVNMQLFEEKQLPLFFLDSRKMANLGAGQIVARDNNPETGELFWNGWLFGDQSYYVQLANGSQTPVDYWLFTDDVISYPLGQSVAAAQCKPAQVGAKPQTAVPLQFGQNQGQLNPGEAIWYSFSVTDTDGEFFEPLALTMIVTPDNGNRIRNITFDIYPAGQVQGWTPGNHAPINNIGAGSVVFRDENPLTGERVWSGWVIDSDLYYLQIRNGNDISMDYWLFAGDIYNSNLGGN
ncbi:MAG: hypothetical protein AB1801_08845, partial [Chloroflexota bacterium]